MVGIRLNQIKVDDAGPPRERGRERERFIRICRESARVCIYFMYKYMCVEREREREKEGLGERERERERERVHGKKGEESAFE